MVSFGVTLLLCSTLVCGKAMDVMTGRLINHHLAGSWSLTLMFLSTNTQRWFQIVGRDGQAGGQRPEGLEGRNLSMAEYGEMNISRLLDVVCHLRLLYVWWFVVWFVEVKHIFWINTNLLNGKDNHWTCLVKSWMFCRMPGMINCSMKRNFSLHAKIIRIVYDYNPILPGWKITVSEWISGNLPKPWSKPGSTEASKGLEQTRTWITAIRGP